MKKSKLFKKSLSTVLACATLFQSGFMCPKTCAADPYKVATGVLGSTTGVSALAITILAVASRRHKQNFENQLNRCTTDLQGTIDDLNERIRSLEVQMWAKEYYKNYHEKMSEQRLRERDEFINETFQLRRDNAILVGRVSDLEREVTSLREDNARVDKLSTEACNENYKLRRELGDATQGASLYTNLSYRMTYLLLTREIFHLCTESPEVMAAVNTLGAYREDNPYRFAPTDHMVDVLKFLWTAYDSRDTSFSWVGNCGFVKTLREQENAIISKNVLTVLDAVKRRLQQEPEGIQCDCRYQLFTVLNECIYVAKILCKRYPTQASYNTCQTVTTCPLPAGNEGSPADRDAIFRDFSQHSVNTALYGEKFLNRGVPESNPNSGALVVYNRPQEPQK